MRVVHLINGLGRGGGERLLVDLVGGLGPEVCSQVFCLTREGPLADELRESGVLVSALSREGVPRAAGLLALRRALARADILHTHFFYSDTLGALARLVGAAPRVVSTRHELGDWMGPVHRYAELPMLGGIDQVLCVSRAVRDALLARGAPASKLVVVAPGIRLPLPSPASRQGRTIVSVGRLERVKGHDVLIAAFARARLDAQGWSLVIVGDGSERGPLEAIARALDVPVRFTGPLAPSEVARELASATLAVLPSRSEGWPLALMEAMAHGLPCIAAAVGGVPELLEDGRTGWLVPPGDARALAARMSEVTAAPERRAQVAREAEQHARAHFGLDRFVHEVGAVYHRVVGA